jgi:hypothetical protein
VLSGAHTTPAFLLTKRALEGALMKIVTKSAMLALFFASLIALNNCGKQSESIKDEIVSQPESETAADYAILGGVPLIYPNIVAAVPFITIETQCGDGTDNDGNGYTDCEDPNCHVHPECAEFGPPLEEIINSRTLTVYPNGLVVPEDIAILKQRVVDDDDSYGDIRSRFFNTKPKDCWIDPLLQDPYYFIPMGEALVAGPEGPIGPQLFPEYMTYRGWGPRAGLINECSLADQIWNFRFDDDNDFAVGGNDDDDDR